MIYYHQPVIEIDITDAQVENDYGTLCIFRGNLQMYKPSVAHIFSHLLPSPFNGRITASFAFSLILRIHSPFFSFFSYSG